MTSKEFYILCGTLQSELFETLKDYHLSFLCMDAGRRWVKLLRGMGKTSRERKNGKPLLCRLRNGGSFKIEIANEIDRSQQWKPNSVGSP